MYMYNNYIHVQTYTQGQVPKLFEEKVQNRNSSK